VPVPEPRPWQPRTPAPAPTPTNPEVDCPQKAVVLVNPVCYSHANHMVYKNSNDLGYDFHWPQASRTVQPVFRKIIDAAMVYRKNHSLLFPFIRLSTRGSCTQSYQLRDVGGSQLITTFHYSLTCSHMHGSLLKHSWRWWNRGTKTSAKVWKTFSSM